MKTKELTPARIRRALDELVHQSHRRELTADETRSLTVLRSALRRKLTEAGSEPTARDFARMGK